MDVVSLVLKPQHQHHDRFYQFLFEYQAISAHIQEFKTSKTSSVHHVEIHPNVIVSCPDPLKCPNSEVLSKWIRFIKAHFFTVYVFTVRFTSILRD